MYVHIVSFKVREGEDITFLELQKFEEKYSAKPAGLDHFHIFKDMNNEHVYFLVEYWDTKEHHDSLEHSDEHQHFHKMREFAIEKRFESYDCEVVI